MTAPVLGFDGCYRACRTAGVHTLKWGGCDHAVEPPPVITFTRLVTASDGYPSIVSHSVTVAELAEQIEGVLNSLPPWLTYTELAQAIAERVKEVAG